MHGKKHEESVSKQVERAARKLAKGKGNIKKIMGHT